MILEDFVMLGTTVPEPNSDGRVFVCSAGVTEEDRRLIRIYPLARRRVPRRWGMYRVRLERNYQDSRGESFQLAADRTRGAHERINDEFEIVQTAISRGSRASLLSRYVVGSIDEANAKRLSLAIIQATEMTVEFDENPETAPDPQMVLFDSEDEQEAGARRFPLMPRLRFHDERTTNRLMLRDWGAFELQRKKGPSYFRDNLVDALHLQPSSSLLVGNMNNQRNAWLVISVLNGIREEPDLFSEQP